MRESIHRKLLIIPIMASFIASPCFGATVEMQGTDASRIVDLLTLGAGSEAPTLYTVTFELITFAELSSRPTSGNIFENSPLPFLYDGRHVVEATEAVVAALNASSALSVGGGAIAFRVPVADSDGYFTFWGGYLNDSQIPGIPVNDWYATGLGSTTDNIPVTFALFSYQAVVPTPPAVWLFASALGVMMWMRRLSTKSESSQ